MEIPLPSGALFPDWSVVTDDRVRASLRDTLGKLRMTRRWRGLGGDEEVLRRAVLEAFVATGRAPRASELGQGTGLSASAIAALLARLEARDLIVRSENDGSIEGAYPFTDRDTEHRVDLDGVTLNAMCAIDALGVGAMLDRDTRIESRCRHCGAAIHIETTDRGRGIHALSPQTALVWSGIEDIDGCAADTQCQVMAFFCSDRHLGAWREAGPAGARGHRLSVPEGLQAGAAIFRPFLADGPPRAWQSG